MTNSNNSLLVRTCFSLTACLTTVALTACSGTVSLESASDAAGGNADSTTSRHASCAHQSPGADHHCGLNQDLDCCADLPVPGGSFNRYNAPEWPATVSDFRLGMMEVTVGRLRAFVNAWPDAWPKPGDGANPHVPGSGWKEDWDQYLPKTREELVEHLHCPYETVPPSDHQQFVTWTDNPGPHEYAPASCLTWFDMFAFCAWDGGRLPTEAELGYAIVGGDEQRPYPWGTAKPTAERVVAGFPGDSPFVPVGNRPAGAARWAHLDFGGSRSELTRDLYLVSPQGEILEPPVPCIDCVHLLESALDSVAIDIGETWNWSARPLERDSRTAFSINSFSGAEGYGFRCAYPAQP